MAHVAGDVREPETARGAVDGMDAVVHLAAHPDAWSPGRADAEVLDAASRGTYALLTAAAGAGVRRIVLASTLDLFEAYPLGWRVLESWRPRPSPEIAELAPYVAELSGRELARATALEVVCLRLGRLVDDADVQRHPADPRWLHLEDAVRAVTCALNLDTARAPASSEPGQSPSGRASASGGGWWVFHIPGGRRARFPLAAATGPAFGYVPGHDFGGGAVTPEPRPATVDDRGDLVPAQPVESRPIRRLTIFGACGPLGAAATPQLALAFTLRLTDLALPDAGAARIATRFPGAPRPQMPALPHSFEVVDVADGDQVLQAAQGAGALLNFTVLRDHPVQAFRVNTIGAYHVMRAAVAHGIRRVVHTGPQILHFEHPAGYGPDFDVPDDAPFRAGANLYFHTKYLGMEICRVFAQNHGLEVATLLFSQFVNPAQAERERGRLGPAAVSWDDAGRAVRRAVELPRLPSPFQVLRIIGDLPHSKFSNARARRILDWAPRDSLRHLWDIGP